MKKLISLSILLMSIVFARAQDKIIDTIPKIDGVYGYQEVVQLDSSYKKDFLYKNAKIYFVNNFKSANAVIQYDNKEDAKIIGKGNITVNDANLVMAVKWVISFTTEIACKDGKYRYRIYDFSIVETRYGGSNHTYVTDLTIDQAKELSQKGTAKKVSARLFNKMADEIKSDILLIKRDMAKKDAISKNDF